MHNILTQIITVLNDYILCASTNSSTGENKYVLKLKSSNHSKPMSTNTHLRQKVSKSTSSYITPHSQFNISLLDFKLKLFLKLANRFRFSGNMVIINQH